MAKGSKISKRRMKQITDLLRENNLLKANENINMLALTEDECGPGCDWVQTIIIVDGKEKEVWKCVCE